MRIPFLVLLLVDARQEGRDILHTLRALMIVMAISSLSRHFESCHVLLAPHSVARFAMMGLGGDALSQFLGHKRLLIGEVDR
mmetsp:Transcript_5210/g.8063  ORF Transcript_5210/g.8063 Transcript_5210/m.8063 type:complete len:82 (+) Transcript_5210:4352-4597(+)